MAVEIGILIAVVGCAVGLAGWLGNRDKRVIADAHWRGEVTAKLDLIVGIRSDVDALTAATRGNTERIIRLEQSVASAHKRLDEWKGEA